MITDHNDNLTPQERLAQDSRRRNRRRTTHRALLQTGHSEGERDSEGFQPNHKMDSAKELVKIGLSEFQDYIDANAAPAKPRKRRQSADPNDISPEILKAREELAQVRQRTHRQDGRTVIKMYSDVMDGLRNDEGFKPHHRIAAGKELLMQRLRPRLSMARTYPGRLPNHSPSTRSNESRFRPRPHASAAGPSHSHPDTHRLRVPLRRGGGLRGTEYAQATAAPGHPGHHRQRRPSGRLSHACHSRV